MISKATCYTDPYLKPNFSFGNKIRRFTWLLSWQIMCRWSPTPFHGWRSFVLRIFGAKIGKKNFIYPNCKIWAPWLLRTEDIITIGPGVEIYNPGRVHLGHHSILSQNAYICGATHDYNSVGFTYLIKEIIIEPYVWICARAIVLPGVHCKQGCVLGSGAVASKDLDEWSVYVGNPAKKIKDRSNFLKEYQENIGERN